MNHIILLILLMVSTSSSVFAQGAGQTSSAGNEFIEGESVEEEIIVGGFISAISHKDQWIEIDGLRYVYNLKTKVKLLDKQYAAVGMLKTGMAVSYLAIPSGELSFEGTLVLVEELPKSLVNRILH